MFRNLCLVGVLLLAGMPIINQPSVTAAVFEQKTVTVTATNSADAQFKAVTQNPGWRAVSARNTDPFDPKSKTWEVTLQR